LEAPIVVALIASVSALSVSLTTGWLQLMQSRAQRRHERDVLRNNQKLEVARERWRERHTAIREFSKALQEFQDEAQLLLRAAPDSSSTGWSKRLVDARDQVIATYREHHMALTKDERLRLQSAKESAIQVLLFLDGAQVWAGEQLALESADVVQVEGALPDMIQVQQYLLMSAGDAVDQLLAVAVEESHE
jgi:TPP-dependent pyruvate/acetoin dehydrogenase alpha subunit